ncbi:MAG: N-acetylglucosamine kinase [Alteromonadaceae bacterium]|jgi:N-acetylglucosamine kinase
MIVLVEGNLSNNKTQLFYGVDIGGTKIEIGVFTSELTLIDSWRIQTPTTNYKAFINAIVTLVNDANSRYSQKGNVGIGMPGIIDKNGLVKSANVSCATGKNIIADLTLALKSDISTGNDCRLFALSESIGGAGDNFKSVYGAIIGTGAAGGFCLDGHIYNGRSGFAGEYGHIPVSAYLIDKYKLPLLACGCGLKGCYEPYVSGPGLGWLYEHFGAKTKNTHHFVQQLNDNDPIATTTFDCYMNLLGASFVSIVLSYDPDIIVLGGGLSKIDKVVEMIPHYVKKHLFSGIGCPPIVRAKYGDSSGVRGAAILRKQSLED